MTSNNLAALADEQLVDECILAADDPIHDIEGNSALLEEARRRRATGALDNDLIQRLELLLGRSENVMLGDYMSPREEVMNALHGLRSSRAAPRPCYLFHGTLKSRLVGIARDGLIPAKRSRDWHFEMSSEHTASGVFFTQTWRQATNWMLVRANGNSARGAILRVPIKGLTAEKDEFASGSGNLVVRDQIIDVGNAHVLLHPFTVTNSWLTVPEAVDACRQERKARRA